MDHDKALSKRLAEALTSKGPGYQARTRHLENGRPVYTNRLIFENSPYLLQHAHNPVDWYNWGAEAFADARRDNKPIFLSIGYATCHWCHVMEEESFENPEVAELLNKHFIAIKVDREVHPDIDQLYMTAVIMISGRGGWPMSSFLTTEGKPFFCGTYYQPLAFIRLLTQIHTTWTTQRTELLDQAEQLAAAISESNQSEQKNQLPDFHAIDSALQAILYNYDAQNGGFSPAPKFPNETMLMLLAQQSLRDPDTEYQAAFEHTLTAMAQGGLFDQIGGGFHRYSVDEYWLVPHFEKMLYNQAYLSRVYCLGFKMTGKPLYSHVIRQTLDFVLREMDSGQGLFYSALDADSEGAEGTFYLWTEAEIHNILGDDNGDLLCQLFGVTEAGNFEGKNILHLPKPISDLALQSGVSLKQYYQRIAPLLLRLYDHRSRRIAPLTDDKIITAWNGMMATALIEAGETLDEPRYINAAQKCVQQLWEQQRHNHTTLQRINRKGTACVSAKQEDYAHFAEALLACYDYHQDPIYLQKAEQLCNEMLGYFGSDNSPALTMGNETLAFAQMQETYDGALPSGNAVAVRILNHLSRRIDNPAYQQRADDIVNTLSGPIYRQPAAYAYLLAQVDERLNGEPGPKQYFASGTIKATAILNGDLLSITFNLNDGISVNAETIQIQPLVISDFSIAELNYSTSTPKSVSFQDTPLSVFEQSFNISAKLNHRSTPSHLLSFNLSIQSCHEKLCLPHESQTYIVQEQ